ncbi:MAG: hypothetical protein GXO58_05050 [Thermodesulfobacteria bacterium]|nr:hypothetical protein [Thermodesulfobacteriota bacterium]
MPDFVLTSSSCEIKALYRRPKVLDLKREQGARITKTYKRYRREAGFYKSKMNLIVLQLNDELCGDNFDINQVLNQIEELKGLCSKMMNLNISTIIQLRQTLDSQQLKLLNSPLFPVRSLKTKRQTRIAPCGGA